MRGYEFITGNNMLNKVELNQPINRILGKQPKTTRNDEAQSLTLDLPNIGISMKL